MVKMEEQTEKQIRRRYVSTGGEDPRRRRSGFLPGLLVGFLVAVIAIGIFFALRGGSGAASPIASSSGSGGAVDAQAVNKLKLLEQYIDYYYYKSDEVSKEDMQNGMFKGLVDSLGDVYSCYFTPQEYQSLQQQTTGVYFGIGAYVSKEIYSVEGKEMNGLELEEVVSYIKGDEGTKVHITIYRNGEPIEMELTRARVTSPTVDSEMKENGIGYLQITEFDDVTTAQFEENFASLKEQGMKGLIIDLRSNPGGNVTTVCEIAEKLLPEGLVFYMEDKNGKRTEYPCKGADFDLPLVVLVNPARRRSSRAPSRTRASASWSVRRHSARASCRRSRRWTTDPPSSSPSPTTTRETATTSISRGSSPTSRWIWTRTRIWRTRSIRSWRRRSKSSRK